MRETRPQMPQPVIVYIYLFIYLHSSLVITFLRQIYTCLKLWLKIAHVVIMYAIAFHCHCRLLDVYKVDKKKQFLSQ